MSSDFLLSGFGGQGVMFAGQLLAYAALEKGFEVTWIPSYGPEMRGGTAHCSVVISDLPIGSPIVSRPGVGLVFNNPSFEKYAPLIAPGGLLVYNASLIKSTCQRNDITTLPIPASEIAEEKGNLRLMNMVMLGAALELRPAVSQEDIYVALEKHLPAHRRGMLPQNIDALQAGARYASEFLLPV